jgi:hypothetical protein
VTRNEAFKVCHHHKFYLRGRFVPKYIRSSVVTALTKSPRGQDMQVVPNFWLQQESSRTQTSDRMAVWQGLVSLPNWFLPPTMPFVSSQRCIYELCRSHGSSRLNSPAAGSHWHKALDVRAKERLRGAKLPSAGHPALILLRSQVGLQSGVMFSIAKSPDVPEKGMNFQCAQVGENTQMRKTICGNACLQLGMHYACCGLLCHAEWESLEESEVARILDKQCKQAPARKKWG